jgi:glycosyltransferase involved in cell wall biosynthesis
MRILHVINSLNPSSGGPTTACASLAAGQALLGHDVAVFGYRHVPSEADIRVQLSGIRGISALEFLLQPVPSKLERLLSSQAGAVAETLVGRCDVVHLHGLWEPLLLRVASACRREGVPYVLAPHGMLSDWSLSEKALKKKVALAVAFRKLVTGASALHALSEHDRECILRAGFHANVDVLPNGVFLEDIDPPPATGAFLARHPELNGDPYILFLARLHPVKGLDLLAEAFATLCKKHARLRLVIAGPDFGAGGPLKEQVARLGVSDRVHLVGPLYGVEKKEAMAGALCFCLPSFHEGFSMSIAEAMAARTPAVFTTNCHLPEVGAAGAAEVIERTVPELTAALDRVVSDPAHRAELSRRGRAMVEERYTWPAIARGAVASYTRVVAASRRSNSPYADGPADVAIITNVQTPYRIALHKRLVREVPEARLWTVYTHGTPDQPWQSQSVEDIRPVNFGPGEDVRRGDSPLRALHEWRKAGRIIDWLREKNVQAVFLCGYNDIGRMRLLRWCHTSGVPVFLVADSNVFGDSAIGLRRMLKEQVLRHVLRWTDMVMPCGRFGMRYFYRYGADPSRVIFFPYEPDYSLIESIGDDDVRRVREKHDLGSGRRMVFCGRMIRAKRPDLAVDAFCRIAKDRPDWELVLIGDGPLRAELQARIPADLRSRVRFLGFIGDQREISAIYRSSDIFLLPSDYEPWGVVVNEAAAAGCAMITSNVVGAAGELVRDGVNGRTFTPSNLDELTTAMMEVSDERNLHAMRENTVRVLRDWRHQGDPVVGYRLALGRMGVLSMHSSSRPVATTPSPGGEPDAANAQARAVSAGLGVG